jgi:hypothetical protein
VRSFQCRRAAMQDPKPYGETTGTAKTRSTSPMRRRFAALAKHLRDTNRKRCLFSQGMQHLETIDPTLVVDYQRVLHDVSFSRDTLIRVYCENGITYIELL